MESKTELKPCPFCGSEARLVWMNVRNTDTGAKAYHVKCTKCQCTQWPDGTGEFPRYGKEAAIAAWNRRAE